MLSDENQEDDKKTLEKHLFVVNQNHFMDDTYEMITAEWWIMRWIVLSDHRDVLHHTLTQPSFLFLPKPF